MFRGFFVAMSLALVAAKPTWRELESYTFEKFVSDYNLNYGEGSDNYTMRKEIFQKELARVVAHNKANASWKENVNHMSALQSSEKKAFTGRSKAVHAAHTPLRQSSVEASDFPKLKVSSLPTDVDWRTEGVVSAVKDQGMCGSCWAFAATATLESHVAIASGQLFDLSPQQIAACSPNPDKCGGTGNCQGATAEIAFDYMASSAGILEEFQYGYSEYFGKESACDINPSGVPKAQITGYKQLTENNYEELMNAVAQKGPIAISVDASTWSAYSSGIFDGCNQKNPDIDHAVVLMGYGTDNGKDYWLVRNSWSASWGENGYIRIARTASEETRCGSDTTPCDGTACDGQCDTPVTVCGTCGILYDSSYPTGANII
jgi:cathepsin L